MLQDQIESLFDAPPSAYTAEHHTLFSSFKDSLNRGDLRAAEPDPSSPTGWRANAWVKKGILLGFRLAPSWKCRSIRPSSPSSTNPLTLYTPFPSLTESALFPA